MQAKRPGPAFELQRAGMRPDYAETFEATRGTGYEVRLSSTRNGDPTLFSRTDFVEDSWRIMQPVLDLWKDTRAADFLTYMAGTWGPLAAADFRRIVENFPKLKRSIAGSPRSGDSFDRCSI